MFIVRIISLKLLTSITAVGLRKIVLSIIIATARARVLVEVVLRYVLVE